MLAYLLATLLSFVSVALGQVGPLPGAGPLLQQASSSIGTPQLLGASRATNSAATVTMTMIGAINANDLVVVCVETSNGNAGINSISDGTNSYVTAQDNELLALTVETWYKANAVAVATSSTITVTLPGAVTPRLMSAFRVANTAAVPLDVHSSASAAATTLSMSTGALAQGRELIAGCNGYADAVTVTSYTGASGFTNLATGGSRNAGNFGLGSDWKIVNTATTVTYSPVWVANTPIEMQSNLVSFKGQ